MWEMAVGPCSSQPSSSSFPLPSCALSWCPATRELHRLLHHGLCDDRAGNRLLRSSASHGETVVLGKGLGTWDFSTSQHKNRGPLAAQPWLLPAFTSCVRAGSPVSQGSILGYSHHRYPRMLGVSESLGKQECINIRHGWKEYFAHIAHICCCHTAPGSFLSAHMNESSLLSLCRISSDTIP